MNVAFRWTIRLSVLAFLLTGYRPARAAEPELSATAMPVRYVFVDGEGGRFQEQNWMKDHYVGGVEDFSAHQVFKNGYEVSADGHAVIDQNDYRADLLLRKEDLGFFHFDYKAFRKYFDGLGGTFYPFQNLTAENNRLSQDLHLDINKLEVETGITIKNLPEVTLGYEYETKYGTKSMITWGSAKEGDITRKIVPSYMDIDEVVNAFTVKGHQDILGVTLSGDQRYELVKAENSRQETNLATTGVASDSKVRVQSQNPETDLATTTIHLERWFLKDKLYVSSGYRFYDLVNKEEETLREFSQTGVPRSFANPENKINDLGYNYYDIHTWVANVIAIPCKTLTANAKFKAEVSHRKGNSTEPVETTDPPNDIPNTIRLADVNYQNLFWGEALSLRYTGIKRAALYTELELQQGRIYEREFETSIAEESAASSGDMFNRDTVVHVWRGVGTVGGQYAPFSLLNLTAHVRRKINNNDYDDQAESAASANGARSAFFDFESIHTDEFATRASLKPCRWFRPSFRYQLRADKFDNRIENMSDDKSITMSHIYTFDGTIVPRNDLSVTLTYSRQNTYTETLARLSPVTNTPTFHGDVSSWLVSTEYTPLPKIALTNMIEYSFAHDFDDYTFNGLPLGADFTRLNVVTGVNYTLAKDLSVGAEYGLYSYVPNSRAEAGDYHAHVVRFEVTKKL